MRAAVILLAALASTLATDAPPVKIQLYYDSYCSFCQVFMIEQLYPTWIQLKEIMDVEMFPFGNAKFSEEDQGWEFKCQHGQDECTANMIHACAKDHFKDIDLEMNFIKCLLDSDVPAHAGPTCAATVGVQWEPLNTCVNSKEGQDLLHDVAFQQGQLDPELYFVPWIIVNDFFSLDQTEDCKNDLKRIVCEKYNGTLPDPCGGYPFKSQELVMLGPASP